MDYIVTFRIGLEDTPAHLACQPRLGHLPQIINNQCSPNFKVPPAWITGSADFKLINYFSRFSKTTERNTMENYVGSYKVGFVFF